jgi:hypothetical protein
LNQALNEDAACTPPVSFTIDQSARPLLDDPAKEKCGHFISIAQVGIGTQLTSLLDSETIGRPCKLILLHGSHLVTIIVTPSEMADAG